MSAREEPGDPAAESALAGVLDRLLARERGAVQPARETERPLAAAAPGVPARRMLAVAGLGPDGGAGALAAVARWALDGGRRPAVLDLACGEHGPAGADAASDAVRIPLACIPCAPERLRSEAPEVLAALLERLRRHECAADLLLVRVPARHRTVVARAAFLGGGLVVPVHDSGTALHEAFHLSRQILESFLDPRVWPHGSAQALARYADLLRGFLGIAPEPFDVERLEPAAVLAALNDAPEEGFASSLLVPDAPAPPAEILRVGSLALAPADPSSR